MSMTLYRYPRLKKFLDNPTDPYWEEIEIHPTYTKSQKKRPEETKPEIRSPRE